MYIQVPVQPPQFKSVPYNTKLDVLYNTMTCLLPSVGKFY